MNQQLINKYDSDFCGNLPIHLINVVQPYGALVVIDKDSKNIIQVSENVQAITGTPFTEMPGSSAALYLDVKMLDTIKDTAPHTWEISAVKYLAILHDKPLYHILEINLQSAEAALNGSLTNIHQELEVAISAIENASSLSEAAGIAAKKLKEASGLDKVMIYRFDEDWNGFVVSEEKESDMESYRGFTFPASDIPKQAREMYLKNPYRLIPDRIYHPVKLYPFINPATDTFIDMSDCNVRGVATVHLEYLKNMNVMASMSVRIIKDNKLWGLIACHHKTAVKVDYKTCAVFELLSAIISTKLSSLETKEKDSVDRYITSVYASLLEETYRGSDIGKSLFFSSASILDLFNAGGAVIAFKGEIRKNGLVPDTSAIEDLLLWLSSRESPDIYYTDNLSRDFDYANDYKESGSGILAIPLDLKHEEYVLLFRPEMTKVINWGGDPEERINFENDMKTYHPRFSFKLWQERVSGVSRAWRSEEINAAKNLKAFIRDFLDLKKESHE